MIRLFLIIMLPLILPFGVWYLWKVFGEPAELDPRTGDQIPPDFGNAPLGRLAIVGVVLMLLTLGVFILVR